MDPTRFDTVTRSLSRMPSRRTTLRTALGSVTLAAAGWLTAPSASHAKKKRKKKKCPKCAECAVCPSLPAVPFCAGKNACAQDEPRFCHQPGAGGLCSCFIQADTSGPFCGQADGEILSAATCEACAAGTVCVLAGGHCPGSATFFCLEPCPNPR